ncbi:MAG: dienelactone hydrolase family protein [Myxococcales bacterium]|nr:dienelactone hydrolase family protein [Myxococcales bacterium]
MQTEPFHYDHHGTTCVGKFVFPEQRQGLQPAVLVAPTWAGCDNFAVGRASWLASLGYVGVAIDLYGGGRVGTSPDENRALMLQVTEDRRFLQSRMLAAVDAVQHTPGVDPDRIAAIGFCFGGLCVLDLARVGGHVRGVVSLHGLFTMPTQRLAPTTHRPPVLVLHGNDDPMAPPDQLAALQKELTEQGHDWQVHTFGRTLHGFTNPAANSPATGVLYNAVAEARSWKLVTSFLEEVLA